MRSLYVAFGVALMASTAQAQTVISREVSEGLVETVVTERPDGSTIVTRQPLSNSAVLEETVVAPAPIVVEEPAARVTTRRVTTVVRPSTGTTVRSNRVVPPAPRAQARTITRETVRTVRAPLALTPVQRQIIYRTIVQREVYAPPARIVAAPIERPLPPALIDSPYTARASALPEPLPPAPVLGSRVSAIESYAMVPEAVAVQVPAARPYRYMVINNRLLLVDPVTSTVVADITED
jgi:hypothetical protein